MHGVPSYRVPDLDRLLLPEEEVESLQKNLPSHEPLVITGASGTGKTFLSGLIAKERGDGNFCVSAKNPSQNLEATIFGSDEYMGALKDPRVKTLFLQEAQGLLGGAREELFDALQSDQRVKLVALFDDSMERLPARARLLAKGLGNMGNSFELPAIDANSSTLRKAILSVMDARGVGIAGMDPKAYESIFSLSMPGNFHDLHDLIGHAKHLSDGRAISDQHMDFAVQSLGISSKMDELDMSLVKTSRLRFTLDVLRVANGNLTKACRMSGMSRTTLYRVLAKHGIDSSDYKIPNMLDADSV